MYLSIFYKSVMLDPIVRIERLIRMHLLWQVFYVVSKDTKEWKGGKGHINKDVLIKGLPSPSDDSLILVSFIPSLHHS